MTLATDLQAVIKNSDNLIQPHDEATISQAIDALDSIEGALRSALTTMSIAANSLEKDGDEHGVAWNLRNEINQAKAVLGISPESGEAVAVPPLKVWLFDDCNFVAAATLEDATRWYDEQFGPSLDGDREIDEVALTVTMRNGEGVDSPTITLAEQIEKLKAAGESFPAVIAIDSHYA